MSIAVHFFRTESNNEADILKELSTATETGLLSSDTGPIVFGRESALPKVQRIEHRYSSKEHFRASFIVNPANNSIRVEVEQLGKNPTFVDGQMIKTASQKCASQGAVFPTDTRLTKSSGVLLSRVFFPVDLKIPAVVFVAVKVNEGAVRYNTVQSNSTSSTSATEVSSQQQLQNTVDDAAVSVSVSNKNINNNNTGLERSSSFYEGLKSKDNKDEDSNPGDNSNDNLLNFMPSQPTNAAPAAAPAAAPVSSSLPQRREREEQQKTNNSNDNKKDDDDDGIQWDLILAQNAQSQVPKARPQAAAQQQQQREQQQPSSSPPKNTAAPAPAPSTNNNNDDDDDEDDQLLINPHGDMKKVDGKTKSTKPPAAEVKKSGNNNNKPAREEKPPRWQWKKWPDAKNSNDNAWADYDKPKNDLLERAFVAKKDQVNLDNTYAVAFCDSDVGMVQYRLDDTIRWRAVRRVGKRNVDRSGVKKRNIIYPDNLYENASDEDDYAEQWDTSKIRPKGTKKYNKNKGNGIITGDSDDSRDSGDSDESFLVDDDDTDDETYTESEDAEDEKLLPSSSSSDASSVSSTDDSDSDDDKKKKRRNKNKDKHRKKEKKGKNREHRRHRDKKDKKDDKRRQQEKPQKKQVDDDDNLDFDLQ